MWGAEFLWEDGRGVAQPSGLLTFADKPNGFAQKNECALEKSRNSSRTDRSQHHLRAQIEMHLESLLGK